jgi:tRNA modification GTPase
VHVIDTAGLRGDADLVEEEGIRRARRAMAEADRVLLVEDATRDDERLEASESLPAGVPVTVIRNKIDLTGETAGVARGEELTTLSLSALTGEGVDLLRRHLEEGVGYRPDAAGALSARRRHLDALDQARSHVETGIGHLESGMGGELLAEELRLAQQVLGEITGAVSSDDLLGRIFASFCIGK